MNTLKSIFIGLGLLLLLHPFSHAQPGSDPAFTDVGIDPKPIPGGVGAPFSMTFTLGNTGAVGITGADASTRMGFVLTFTNATPSPLGVGALSGPLLNYFDITYDATANTFNGVQKLGVPIARAAIYSVFISAVVVNPSAVTNNIGASGQIAPNSSAGNQPTGNDKVASFTHTVAPMPVSLVWFKAEAQPDRRVAISWQTSLESSNKGYVVERSKDLTRFESIGDVTDVAGDSRTVTTYHFSDPSPYKGTSYYRLRQVDLSGTSRTYAAQAVTVDGVYGVYPNPVVTTGFTLLLDEPATAVIHLYTTSGQAVSFEKSISAEGSLRVTPTSKLSAGIYVLTVGERAQVRQHRLVIQ